MRHLPRTRSGTERPREDAAQRRPLLGVPPDRRLLLVARGRHRRGAESGRPAASRGATPTRRGPRCPTAAASGATPTRSATRRGRDRTACACATATSSRTGATCQECHADASHGGSRVASSLGHAACSTCHDGKTAGIECTICHVQQPPRDVTKLPPSEALTHTAQGGTLHGMGDLTGCPTCHARSSCASCHEIPLRRTTPTPSRSRTARTPSPTATPASRATSRPSASRATRCPCRTPPTTWRPTWTRTDARTTRRSACAATSPRTASAAMTPTCTRRCRPTSSRRSSRA